MYSRIAVFDLETTMYSPVSNPAHPMWNENRIVMAGVQMESHGMSYYWCSDKADEYGTDLSSFIYRIKTQPLWVGQNIKFDLLYLLSKEHVNVVELSKYRIWDTQLAEYLLSGQQATYASLDQLAVRYGGEIKDSAVSEFFAAGKGADHVPESMLYEYLKSDVTNTTLVFKGQLELAIKMNMLPLIETQMQALKATTVMEYNGMAMNTKYIDERLETLTAEIAEREFSVAKAVASMTPVVGWSWQSPKDVSLLFFGGDYKHTTVDDAGFYKNGKPKTKRVEHVMPLTGPHNPESVGATKTKLGYYTVDDNVLGNIGTPLAADIRKLRTLSKQKETYFENIKALLFPSDRIHPNLNHTATKTGRLSCTRPNIQNQTEEGGIKRAYVSRWGDKGQLVDFDYAQLEMVALAYLSNDATLINDINSGVDMHEALYRDMHGRTPTKEERKPFKRMSFGLVYGAGYKVLAVNSGCSEKDAKRFIKVFYSRYSGVKEWHASLVDKANEKRIVTKLHDMVTGHPIAKYTMSSPTGRMYVFREYHNEWKGGMSFSPTELKNYPVQGFATGDVVPFMVGEVVDALLRSDMVHDAVPIMTVHDSMLFDVKKEIVDKFITRCYNVLKNTTPLVNKMFKIDLPVTLSVGCSVGNNWQDMTERKFI
jgi:DNA polymerase I-like protein with 3'-5' exonuclease and polymerase domains